MGLLKKAKDYAMKKQPEEVDMSQSTIPVPKPLGPDGKIVEEVVQVQDELLEEEDNDVLESEVDIELKFTTDNKQLVKAVNEVVNNILDDFGVVCNYKLHTIDKSKIEENDDVKRS